MRPLVTRCGEALSCVIAGCTLLRSQESNTAAAGKSKATIVRGLGPAARQVMSSIPQLSALDANTQIFPALTAAQIERARGFGKVRKVAVGEILFKPGDLSVPFFIVLSGELDILQPNMGQERLITRHVAGGFTGELSMISGQ